MHISDIYLGAEMRKDNRAAVSYLSFVFTPFTLDWILAEKILICLQTNEILKMEELSKAWQGLCRQNWFKKPARALFEKKPELKPWHWQPRVPRNLTIVFIKIYYCVEHYIKTHKLTKEGNTHLRSKLVARAMIDGELTICQAARRTQTKIVAETWIIPRTGIELGIDPAILLNSDGTETGFGPFHIRLVDENDVPPKLINGLSTDQIKALLVSQTLFAPSSRQPKEPSLRLEKKDSDPVRSLKLELN